MGCSEKSLAVLEVHGISFDGDGAHASLVLANKLDDTVDAGTTRVASVITNARADLIELDPFDTFRAGVDISVITSDNGPNVLSQSLVEDGGLDHRSVIRSGSVSRRAGARLRFHGSSSKLVANVVPLGHLHRCGMKKGAI